MAGGGGASSIGYAKYIQAIHELVMRGGTIDQDGDSVNSSYVEFGITQGLIRKMQDALEATTIRDELDTYVFDPNQPSTTKDGYLRRLTNYSEDMANLAKDGGTQLTSEQLTEFITRATTVDDIKSDFDYDGFRVLLTSVFSDTVAEVRQNSRNSMTDGMSLVSTSFDTLKSRVDSDISTVLTEAITSINGAISTVSNEAEVTATTDLIGSLTTSILNSVDNRVNTVLTKMLNVTLAFESQIDVMVDAYSAQVLSRHQQAAGRLSASMGLKGASTSSSMAVGMANLEEERIRDIQNYRSTVESDLRDKLFSLYQNTGQEISASYQAYQVHLADKSAKLISFVQSFVNSYVSNLQTLYGSLDRTHGVAMSSMDSRNQIVANPIGQASLQDQATEDRNRFSTLVNLLNDKKQSFEEELKTKDMLTKVTQMAYIANKEYYDKKAELQYQNLRWDLDTFAYLGNFLGAPGSSVTKTNELTTGQTVMGAAASGAMIGSVGGVPGAVGGAIIGGLAGLASSGGQF